MKPTIIYLLYEKKSDGIFIKGIFSDSEIKKYRKQGSKCLIVPLNKFVESGVQL